MSWLDGFFTGIRTVFSKGTLFPPRPQVDFEGSGVTVTDDPANNQTTVTISSVAGVATVTGSLPITSSGGANPDIAINPATTIAAGSMSAADKTKLNGIAAGASVVSVTGTAPIVSSGGANPALSITPASGGNAGSMSAADYTSFHTSASATAAATAAATPGTIVKRDGSGGTSVVALNVSGQATFDSYILPALDVLGTGSPTTGAPDFVVSSATQVGANASRNTVLSTGDTVNAASGSSNLLTGQTTGAFNTGAIIVGTGSTNNAAADSGDTTVTTGQGLSGGDTGDVRVYSGKVFGAGGSGDARLESGPSTGGKSGDIIISPDTTSTTVGNISLGSATPDFQAGQLVIFIADRVVIPGGDPSGGGILWSEGGALMWHGSGGTITTIAPS